MEIEDRELAWKAYIAWISIYHSERVKTVNGSPSRKKMYKQFKKWFERYVIPLSKTLSD